MSGVKVSKALRIGAAGEQPVTARPDPVTGGIGLSVGESTVIVGRKSKWSVSKQKIADRPSQMPSWAWPCLVDTTKVPSITTPLARYYCYIATDHDGRGGVRLLYSNKLAGPWSVYSGGADPSSPTIIYEDLDDTPTRSPANSTETPSVVFDEKIGKLRMFYHCINPSKGTGSGALPNLTDPGGARSGCVAYQASQGTMCAVQHDGDTSGVSFTKDRGFALDLHWRSIGYGISEHTGYFTPFKVRGTWYSYHLGGGGNAGAMLLSRCIGGDLSKWETSSAVLPRYVDLCTRAGLVNQQVGWIESVVIETGSGLMLLGKSAEIGSGTDEIPGALFIAPIADDLRTITGEIVVLDDQVDPTWERDNMSKHVGWKFNDDGSLDGIFVYQDTMGLYHVR